jgi:hypothetical protein
MGQIFIQKCSMIMQINQSLSFPHQINYISRSKKVTVSKRYHILVYWCTRLEKLELKASINALEKDVNDQKESSLCS